MRIHFICRGNAYRSRMAEAYFRCLNTGIEVVSSGYAADDRRTINEPVIKEVDKYLAKVGIYVDLKPEAEQLTQENLHDDDIVICANHLVYDGLHEKFTLPPDTRVWELMDFGEGITDPKIAKLGFEEYTDYLLTQIKDKIDELVRSLKTK